MENWYKRIYDLRNKKHLTRKEVAYRLNITEQSLINYEKGYYYPKLDTVIGLSDLYDTTLSYIAFGNNSELKLESDSNKTLAIITALLINKKIEIHDLNIIIKDKELSKYVYYLNIFQEKIANKEYEYIEKALYFLKNVSKNN